jgi:hypothetical protein
MYSYLRVMMMSFALSYLFLCAQSYGALWKKLFIPFHHPHLTSRNFVFETPGGKPGGSRAARVVGAAVEPPGFSPGVSKMELWEVKCG